MHDSYKRVDGSTDSAYFSHYLLLFFADKLGSVWMKSYFATSSLLQNPVIRSQIIESVPLPSCTCLNDFQVDFNNTQREL